MPSITIKPKNTVRSKRRPTAKAITNIGIFQQVIADQKFIREAIQSDVTFQELKDKYGFKFATV